MKSGLISFARYNLPSADLRLCPFTLTCAWSSHISYVAASDMADVYESMLVLERIERKINMTSLVQSTLERSDAYRINMSA